VKRLEAYDVFSLPASSIYYDAEFNCRGQFTLQSVKDLADSITAHGLQFPLVVQRWDGPGFAYRLVAGHRRFKAVTLLLKWTEIPAMIREGLTEHEARLLNVTENLERKDLNLWEEARALRHLYPNGVTLRQAAQELKRPTHWVHVRLRLLRMPESVQQKAAAGLLSAANLDTLAGIDSPEDQVIAAGKIVEARQRGKGKFLPGLDRACKRPRGVRSREEINRMVERMLEAGVGGLAPRVGAWCAGHLSDAELLADIEATPKTPLHCD